MLRSVLGFLVELLSCRFLFYLNFSAAGFKHVKMLKEVVRCDDFRKVIIALQIFLIYEQTYLSMRMLHSDCE